MSSLASEHAETLVAETLGAAYESRKPPLNIADFLKKQDKPGKTCCIFAYGRSGSFLAGSFFDDHPQVMTVHPEAIMGGSYDRLVTTEFLAVFNFALDGSIAEIGSWCDRLLSYMPLFFREVRGQPQYDCYRVVKHIFRSFLLAQLLLTERGTLTFQSLMKMIMIAYRLARGGPMEVDKPMSFIWQAHDPSKERQAWIKAFLRDQVMVTAVRLPEKALDSALVHQIMIGRARPLSAALRRTLFEHMARDSELRYAEPGTHFAVRFEDLHHNTADVLRAMCALLEVPFYDKLCDTTFAMAVTDRTVTGRRQLLRGEFECRLLNYYDRIKVRFLLQEEYRMWEYAAFCDNGLEASVSAYHRDEIVQTLPFGAQALFAEYQRDGYARFDSYPEQSEREAFEGVQVDLEMRTIKELFRIERERRDRGLMLIPLLFSPRKAATL